jgi:hypothetical protein
VSASRRAPSPASYRRRRAAALLALLLGLVAVVVVMAAASGGDEAGSADDAAPQAEKAQAPQPPPPPELPRGGRTIFPDHRVVGFYGAPQADELGILGIGTLSLAGRRLERQARPYNRKTRPVLPAMELIAVIANASPGEDGKYRTRQTSAVIRRHLRAARRVKALLVLDIQPGQSDFFTETVRLRRWLREPDVGLAIDPEWRMSNGGVPGTVIGSVGSREVNATTAWLDRLVRRLDLPQKLFVIHQFTDDMVDDAALKHRKGLAMVLNADGFGGQEVKIDKYRAFTRTPRKFFFEGFKLFYKEDVDLLTPAQVMRLTPRPDFVVYE